MPNRMLMKARRPALDKPVVTAFTRIRAGLPYKSHLSDVTNFHRWATSWVYVCMERNATACSDQPIRMFRRDGDTPRKTRKIDKKASRYLKGAFSHRMTDDAVEVEDHNFLDVMARPNPILDRMSLVWLTAAQLQLGGSAYWHIYKLPDGRLGEIWPLPSQYVWPVMGPDRLFDKYQLRIGGSITVFDAEEIIHFRKPSVIDTLAHFGFLRGVIEAAETNTRMLEYERALFENFAVPDILISAKGEATPAQLDAIRQQFEEQHSGWTKAGKAAVAPVEIDVVKLGMTMRDLQFEKGKAWIRDEIAAGFGVPLPVIKADGTPFNNITQGIALWKRNTVRPLLSLIAETINCQLMPMFMPQPEDRVSIPERNPWFVAFDDPTPEDIDATVDRLVKLLAAGAITFNQALRELEEDEVAWGDEPWLNAGLRQPTQLKEECAQTLVLNQQRAELTSRESDSSIEQATADGSSGPSLTELVQAVTQFVGMGDLDAANMVRDAIATRFGSTLDALADVIPSPPSVGGGGIVNPDENQEAVDLAFGRGKGEQDTSKPQGQGGQEGEGEGQKPPKESDDDDKGKTGEGGRKDGDHAVTKDDGAYNVANDSQGGFNTHRYRDKKPKNRKPRRKQEYDCLLQPWLDSYTKFAREIMDPENQDKTVLGAIMRLRQSIGGDVLAKLETEIDRATRAINEGDKPDLRDTLDRLLDKKRWADIFAQEEVGLFLPLIQHGSELAAGDLARLDVPGDLLDPAKIKEIAEKFAFDSADSVVETMSNDLAIAMHDLFESEPFAVTETPYTIGRKINAILRLDDPKRGEMIARTEINNALNAGATQTWVEAGIAQHKWLASVDACEFCDALDGKTVKIGKPFAKMGSTLRGTKGGIMRVSFRDVLHPTLHPHCVCTVVPIV